MSLSSFPAKERLSALSYITQSERVVYAETPPWLEVNVVPVMVGSVSTTLFLLQVGLALFSTVKWDDFLPGGLLQGLVLWCWYPAIAFAVVRAIGKNAARYLVLTSAKVVYNAGAGTTVAVVPYGDISSASVVEGSYVRYLFESDILLTFSNASGTMRLSCVRQPKVVEHKINALSTLARRALAAGVDSPGMKPAASALVNVEQEV